MRIVRLPCLFIGYLALRTVLCQSDKYTDENRPYKFGFNIEGYQHRQEEKDEKGIIKGEYGFITADGYYRVTVYATDENGDFRIISMKNIYVGFPPEDPQTTPQPPPQAGRGIQLPDRRGPQPNTLSVPGPGGQGGDSRRQKDPVELTGLTACSDCVIPTTKRPGLGSGGITGGSPAFGARTRGGVGGGGAQQRFGGGVGDGGSRSGGGGGGSGGFGGQGGPGGRSGGGGGGGFGGPGRGDGGITAKTRGRTGGSGGFPGTNRGGTGTGFIGGGGRGQGPQNQFSGGVDNGGTQGRRPALGSVRDGLPQGVTVDDIKALLYRFNYTVGFHGHHEDGYRNGDKEGDYFFDGRDGVERRVEYIANEFGYQPNITFIDLPENDVRRPNENTEKEYGLKGYEFKWFYKK